MVDQSAGHFRRELANGDRYTTPVPHPEGQMFAQGHLPGQGNSFVRQGHPWQQGSRECDRRHTKTKGTRGLPHTLSIVTRVYAIPAHLRQPG